MRIATALSIIALAFSAQAQTSDNHPKLKEALKRFPQADTNGDGVLTMAEAKAIKKKGAAKSEPGDDGDSIVSEDLEPLLKLYEAREFEGVKYRLLKPIDLAENPGKKYPMILSLHGAAGKGDDNIRNLRAWNHTMAQDELRRKHPCFVVVPQSPAGPWQTPGTAADFTDDTGDSEENTGVTKYASDKCDKTVDVWDWLFAQKRLAPPVHGEGKPDAAKATEKPTPTEVPVSRKARTKGQDGGKRGARLEPTHADVGYGDKIK